MTLKILSELVSAIKTIPVTNVSWPWLSCVKIINSYPQGCIWTLKHSVVCKIIIIDEYSWSFIRGIYCTLFTQNDQCISFWKKIKVQ